MCSKHVHSIVTRAESLSLSYRCHKQTETSSFVYHLSTDSTYTRLRAQQVIVDM